MLTKKLFSNTTLTYSRYSFNTDFGVNSTYTSNNETEIWDVNFGYLSGIEDLGARIDFDFIPISASAVYSPLNPTEHTLEVLKNSENILNYLFINLIPQEDKISLIIGYHKSKSDKWILEYISSLK